MTQSPTPADYAASYVRQFGMAIVPLPPRSKRPVTDDWGDTAITDPQQARDYYTQHPTANMGVALGPSRLCSFDVDDIEATRAIFAEFGWDLDSLRDSYPTIQGQAPGFRVMFRVPDDMRLPYHSLTWPKNDGSRRRVTVWEIRSADDTQQRQDVLPPSIHPDTGEPYRWLTRPVPGTGFLPPPEFLLRIWENWEALKPQFQAVCPWAAPPTPTQARRHPAPRQSDSVIDAYAQAEPIEATLERYGYRRQGKRYLSPHSTTGLPGVVVIDGKAFIHHASDPLCTDESGRPVDSFDLFAEYEHGGDKAKAMRAAAIMLGMEYTRAAPQPAQRERVDPETGEITYEPAANDNHPARPPMDIFAEFPAPPITDAMLPEAIAAYSRECGQLIGVEDAMIAIPAIVACASALHDGVRIQPKRHETDWTESARLWCAIVGSPSVKKSPAIRRATKRLRKIDRDLADTNARTGADYAEQMDAYKEAKKEAKKTGTAIAAPERPQMRRMIVEDITVEALSEVLKDNDRGVLCIQDELSGWFGSMDAYTGGKAGNKDRAAWLQAYNGGFRQVDRVMRGSVYIPNFSVSMIGGIQPDAIRRIAKDMTDDGLMQRFMVVIGRNQREHDRAEDSQATRAFSDLVDSLHSIVPGHSAITLSEGAHQLRERLLEYAGELADYPALPGGLRSHLGKWSGLFARLLLVYHAIDCITRRKHPSSEPVHQDTAERVDLLMRRFLLPHALAYYTDILGASGDLEHARWVAGHILSKQLSVISNRDLVQAYKQWRGLDDWRRQRIMQYLEDAAWVFPDQTQGKRGTTSWSVNTLAHAHFATKAAEESERRDRIRAEIAAMQAHG